MHHGIKVWRWSLKHQHWYPHSHVGTTNVRQAESRPGHSFGPGHEDGDWAIEVEGAAAPKVTRVKASEVGSHGTIWYCNRHKEWCPVAHRSHHSHRPDFLSGLDAEHGEILIDVSHKVAGDDPNALPYVMLKWNGERSVFHQEVVAVADDDKAEHDGEGHGEIGTLSPPEQREVAERAELAEEAAELIDRLLSRARGGKDNLVEILRDYGHVQAGDPRLKQFLLILKQFVVDLAPAPTAGTLALVDYLRYIDDVKRAATGGIDDAGDPLDPESGTFTSQGAQELGAVGDLLAAAGSVAEYIVNIKEILQSDKIPLGPTGDAQFQGTLKETAASAVTAVLKLYPSLMSGVNTVLQLHQPASQAAVALQAVVPSVPFVSTAVGILEMVRAWRKAIRARRRQNYFARQLRSGDVRSEEMRGALAYAMGKTFRKARTQLATGVAAGAGASGGAILGMTAILGAANSWNPVGWVLLGAAVVGGTGIVGYKFYKRVTRKARYERRIAKGWPQTPGELATLLLKIARDERHPDRRCATLMLENFGVHADSIFDRDLHETAKDLIARHLK